MRQGQLGGRTAGLRPAQRRRLEQLCHRRHPPAAVAELLCLQRLATESRDLELPLTLVIDGRGLCRLLWVGPLQSWGQHSDTLPGARRGQGGALRLVPCCGRCRQLEP
ncbi:MAG: GTPase HflX, partial [Synechococcaceae cyanobacterium]